MKQGTNFILPVSIDYDLTLVSNIDFVFKQPIKTPASFSPKKILDGVQKTFAYPSDTATLSTTEENTINLHWAVKDTYKFNPEEIIYLDTRLTLKNSTENPETEIVKIKMLPTLFKEGKA
jgi:hypothetical protein